MWVVLRIFNGIELHHVRRENFFRCYGKLYKLKAKKKLLRLEIMKNKMFIRLPVRVMFYSWTYKDFYFKIVPDRQHLFSSGKYSLTSYFMEGGSIFLFTFITDELIKWIRLFHITIIWNITWNLKYVNLWIYFYLLYDREKSYLFAKNNAWVSSECKVFKTKDEYN